VIGDRVPEPDQDFFVQLDSPTGGARIATGRAEVLILDNEPRISINDVSMMEGDSGSAPMTFTVSLSAAYNLLVNVNYITSDGSASAGSDYVATAGAVTFDPGQTTQTITVMVNGDRVAEPDETFLVNLSTPNSYAAISNAVGAGTIVDSSPRINITDVYNYGESSATFTVSLSRQYDQSVTVDFATADGTALAGVDYATTSGTLTFNPGEPTTQTITVGVINPASPNTYFYVHLTGASTNALIANEWGTGYLNYDSGYYSDPYSGYYWYWYY
jgi:hypothetical protein